MKTPSRFVFRGMVNIINQTNWEKLLKPYNSYCNKSEVSEIYNNRLIYLSGNDDENTF